MSLRVKFNLILGLAGILAMDACALLAKHFLEKNAQTEVLVSARMVLQSAMAIRDYTIKEIKPLVATVPDQKFHPQTVPAYSANQYIARLREKYPEYNYKEATLNPSNPVNRTLDWEADIVNFYRSNPNAKEQTTMRDTPTGRVLHLSQPMVVNDKACLSCHDTPETAPPSMVALYGPSNGFGWKMDEIIGARIVTIPMKLPMQRAQHAFYILLAALAGIFVVIGILLNILLHYIVIKPVRKMAENANKVSLGDLQAGELAVTGNDEISSLGHSFNRMHRSLSNAIKMLDDSES